MSGQSPDCILRTFWEITEDSVRKWVALAIVLFFSGVSAVIAVIAVPRFQAGSTRLRFIHSVSNGDSVDVCLDGLPLFNNVSFRGVSDYVELEDGDYTFTLNISGDGCNAPTPILSEKINVPKGRDISLIASGLEGSIELLEARDNNKTEKNGWTRVRFWNLAPDVDTVDVYAGNSCSWPSVPVYLDVAYHMLEDTYISAPAGVYNWSICPAGEDSTLVYIPALALDTGAVYTVYIFGAVADGTLSAALSVDQFSSSTGPAYVRVLNVSDERNAIDICLDGDKRSQLNTTRNEAVTDYAAIPTGNFRVKFVNAADGCDSEGVVSAEIQFSAFKAYTLALLDFGDGPVVQVEKDYNNVLSGGTARVRFWNLSDISSVDVYAGDDCGESAIPIFLNTGTLELAREGYKTVYPEIYNWSVCTAGTNERLVHLPGLVFEENKVYTLYTLGHSENGTLTTKLSLDRIPASTLK